MHPGSPAASRLAALLLTAALLVPRGAAAFGSYDSDLETGSAIALPIFGALFFVPTAIILMDEPLTAQTITGRSLILAGSLVTIAACAWYYSVDDPLWYPHAVGWGAGGGLITTGLILAIADDAGDDEDAVEPSGEEPAGEEQDRLPEPAADPAVAFAPTPVPGGFGFVVAARW